MPGDATPRGSRGGSRAQQVAAEIEARILADRLSAGSRLGLRTELINRFEVSPSVMNEALGILRERNLIVVRPGPNGGVFVANPPPQVRLGGVDLWHQGLTVDPEQLFEARAYLDALFPPVALQRASPEDVRAMEWALHDMQAASDDPRAYLDANMRLHLAIARASRIEVLVGLYQTIVSILSATLTKATYVEGSEELRRHNLDVHSNLVAAIRDRDAVALEKILALHRQDMVRIA